MKELILIRHGESEHHLNDASGGWTNSPLTEHGRAQAQMTAQFLKERAPFRPDAIVSSDLARAADTAAIIAREIGLRVEETSQIRELNNGIAAGLRREDAERIQNPFTEPALDWVPFPNGESWRMMYERISAFLSTMRTAQRDNIILISHANAIICMINWFLKLDTEDNLRHLMYKIRPCSITHLRRAKDQSRIVVRLNDTEHLTHR
jgi:2,3-bisphosphoglycerate-dependent phosphoglycerate mutase